MWGRLDKTNNLIVCSVRSTYCEADDCVLLCSVVDLTNNIIVCNPNTISNFSEDELTEASMDGVLRWQCVTILNCHGDNYRSNIFVFQTMVTPS